MTTYRAKVSVQDGMLHTSRPLTAPDQVADLIESVVYSMRQDAGGDVQAIEVSIDTAGESDTPIGDSVSGTSSTPLPPGAQPDPAADVPAPDPAAQPVQSA